jgi:hypothetical protein
MTNSFVAANAMAVVTGVGYVVCRVLSWVVPGWLFTIAQSWFHTFNVAPGVVEEFSSSTLLIGLITSMAVAWIWTYAVVALYKRWAKS